MTGQSGTPENRPLALRNALAQAHAVCECGHTRLEHWADTGAQGSFGGSACSLCWTCPTFRPLPLSGLGSRER